MTANTCKIHVQISRDQDDLLKSLVVSGEYKSVNEAVRCAIDALDEPESLTEEELKEIELRIEKERAFKKLKDEENKIWGVLMSNDMIPLSAEAEDMWIKYRLKQKEVREAEEKINDNKMV